MFNFNCYSCGAKLGDFPTLDALSVEQASALDNIDPEGALKRLTLVGTRFEGMSAGSFCEFCLWVISEHPNWFDEKANRNFSDYRQLVEKEMSHLSVDKHALINRLMLLPDYYEEQYRDDHYMLETDSLLSMLVYEGVNYLTVDVTVGITVPKEDAIMNINPLFSRWELERMAAVYVNLYNGHDIWLCNGASVYSETKGHYVFTCWSCDFLVSEAWEQAAELAREAFWETGANYDSDQEDWVETKVEEQLALHETTSKEDSNVDNDHILTIVARYHFLDGTDRLVFFENEKDQRHYEDDVADTLARVEMLNIEDFRISPVNNDHTPWNEETNPHPFLFPHEPGYNEPIHMPEDNDWGDTLIGMKQASGVTYFMYFGDEGLTCSPITWPAKEQQKAEEWLYINDREAWDHINPF